MPGSGGSASIQSPKLAIAEHTGSGRRNRVEDGVFPLWLIEVHSMSSETSCRLSAWLAAAVLVSSLSVVSSAAFAQAAPSAAARAGTHPPATSAQASPTPAPTTGAAPQPS